MVKPVSLLAFSLGVASVLWAQQDRGSLTGAVKDSTGSAVVGAKVTATHVDTNISLSTATTDTGDYTLASLNIGSYRVEVEATGFKRAVRPGVTVTSGSTLRLDFTVEIGAVSESVQVSAQASALETETTRVATSLTTKLIEDLPLVVAGQIRNVFNLALIAPEVRTNNGYRIGGAQGSGWEMNMDGSSLTSASTAYQTERAPISSVPVDAIAEFTVESTGMKAEYGRAMGQISFVTKSGTNQIHGNMFEFLRNNATDSRGFFAQSAPVLKQNDFGFTVGGPVYIPKIYNGRNKTFFFASYEGFRNRSGNTPSFNTVPLEEMYNGDFRGWVRTVNNQPFMMPIYDPATTTLNADGRTYTRQPFASNTIPRARFSSVANKYIGFRPKDMVANQPGINRNYFRDRGTDISPWNKFSVRADHNFNSANRVSFLYLSGTKDDLFGADGPPGLPVPFNGGSEWYRKNSSGRFSWDRTVSARVLNSLRVSYQREAGGLTTINSLDPNAKWAEKLGLKNTPGPDRALTSVTFAGYSGWSGSAWGFDRGRDLIITDDITFVRGSHTFKFGGFFQNDQWWGGGQHRPNGSFDFSAGPTGVPNDTTGLNGNGFASFLLGQATTWGLETPRAVIQTWKYYGGFFQDDWRVNSRLTLNLGLRYEYTSPIGGGAVLDIKDWTDFGAYTNPSGFMNFDPTVPNPVVGGLLGSTVYTGNCKEGCNGQKYPFDSYKRALAPRIGVAYQVKPGTVIRMYAGRSFGAVKTTGGSTHFQGLILNSSFGTGNLPAFTYFNIDNGLPAWQQPPFRGPATDLGGTTYLWQKSDSGRPPVYYSWNLDLQHQLPKNFVASAGYTATRGVRLTSSILNVNQMNPRFFGQYGRDLLLADISSPAARAANIPIPYPAFRGSVSQALRPFPHYGDVATGAAATGERTGDSTYHAMILKLDKRYSSGLTLLSSYVLSKLFSNADTALASGRDTIDHYNRNLQKALSWDDQTHTFRQAFSYELPFGKGRHWAFSGAANRALGGWGISGFMEYGSGSPLNVGPGFSPVPGGMGNRVWVNSYDGWRGAVAGEKFDPFKDSWWNPAAFQVAADGRKLTTAELNSAIGNTTKNNPKARQPWNLNENISVAKDMSITERLRFTLRFEAFNLLNRTRWGGPDSTVTSPTFGQIRGQANAPRRMQAGAKFVF